MNNNGGEWRILMAESGLKMLLIKIVCILINVCTLFLAVPWTTVLYYNNWAERVVLGGKKLSFTGSAGGFFMVWLKTLFLSTITLSIYYWLIGRKNVARWVDSSIQWAWNLISSNGSTGIWTLISGYLLLARLANRALGLRRVGAPVVLHRHLHTHSSSFPCNWSPRYCQVILYSLDVVLSSGLLYFKEADKEGIMMLKQ